MINKKLFSIILFLIVNLLILSGTSFAENNINTYPNKPIQVIIPAGPGGDTDTNARIIAKYLEKALGTDIAVVNMEGAGSLIASQHVMQSKPDGYTVMFYHSSLYLAKIFGVTDYDFEAFKQGPIVTLEPGNTFAIRGDDDRFSNLDEFIEYGKKHPGELKMGIEIGGTSHMLSLAFADATGLDLKLVDVGGQSAKNASLLGGHVDAIYGIVSPILQYIKSGDMVSLGITAKERQDDYDFIPTFKEQGINLVVAKPYYYLFPKNTPKEIIDTFTEGVKNATEMSGYEKDLANVKLRPKYMNPESARKFLIDQRDYFKMLYDKVN